MVKRLLTAAFTPRQRRKRHKVHTHKEPTARLPMRLFSPDLYRHFAFGFAAGAALVAGASVDRWSGDLAPPVQAAERAPAPDSGLDSFLATGQVKAD